MATGFWHDPKRLLNGALWSLAGLLAASSTAYFVISMGPPDAFSLKARPVAPPAKQAAPKPGLDHFSAGVQEVLRMLEADADLGVVLAHIGTAAIPYQLSGEDIIALHERQVAPEIVVAMIRHDALLSTRAARGLVPNPPAQPPQAPALPPALPGAHTEAPVAAVGPRAEPTQPVPPAEPRPAPAPAGYYYGVQTEPSLGPLYLRPYYSPPPPSLPPGVVLGYRGRGSYAYAPPAWPVQPRRPIAPLPPSLGRPYYYQVNLAPRPNR
jgi:hypothetical protein